MKKVDLNVDIGEGYQYDDALLEFATSANVCCGRHAGSWDLTESTVEMCREKGVRIGIHPGFPDRGSMGRSMPSADDAKPWASSVVGQVRRFWEAHPAAYLKPHGAWYNIVARPSAELAGVPPEVVVASDAALRDCLRECPIPVMLAAGCFASTRQKAGTVVIAEGFADRRYLPDGSLVSRSQPDALLTDPEEIKAQVLDLATRVDSICLHGDNPHCLKFAELVYKTLVNGGFEVGF